MNGLFSMRQRRHPHEDQEQRATGGGDAHGDPGDQGHTDAEQAAHEQPVRPDLAGHGLEEPAERALDTGQEPCGRAPAGGPGALRWCREAEAEQLVDERPQEHEADADPGDGGRDADDAGRPPLDGQLSQLGVEALGADGHGAGTAACGGHGVLLGRPVARALSTLRHCDPRPGAWPAPRSMVTTAGGPRSRPAYARRALARHAGLRTRRRDAQGHHPTGPARSSRSPRRACVPGRSPWYDPRRAARRPPTGHGASRRWNRRS